MPTLTLSLSNQSDRALGAIAEATNRSKADLVQRAVDAFLSHEAWQIAAIQEGIAEADAGKFVEHDSLRRHWEAKLADSLD